MGSTTTVQRLESAAIAVAVCIGFIVIGYQWWWLPVLFLLFDLSMIGYLFNPSLGAKLYNLGHSYTVPALLAGVALFLSSQGYAVDPLGIVSGAWLFHIAVDRALGYGLKRPDSFSNTHLGRIGKQATT